VEIFSRPWRTLFPRKLGSFLFGEEVPEAGIKYGDPGEEEAEIISDGGEEGVGGVSGAPLQRVPLHSVISFEMSDDGFNG
jgi:hypothetical protein